MKHRIATLVSPQDIGASGTNVYPINIDEPISRINILFKFTVVTVSVMTARIIDCISKIEIIAGSEVLASLSGAQLAALNCFNRKRLPFSTCSLTVGGSCEQMISFDFGRWLFDESFAFDPSLYKNPQLRITWDEDAANGSVVVNSLAIYAIVMSELEQLPSSCLLPREWINYTFGTSSHENVELPVDRSIRQILFNANSADHSPVDLISTVKLSSDNDKRVIFDIPFDDLKKMVNEKYPRFSYQMILDAAVTAKTIYANLSDDLDIEINYDGTLFVTAQSKFAVPTFTGNIIALAASVDIKANTALISGTSPFNCISYLFGDEWTPSEWLNFTSEKSLKLDLLSSSDADTGDDCSIVIEQVKTANN